MTVSAEELAEEFIETYRRQRGDPSRNLDHYVRKGEVSDGWREACALVGQYGRTLHDLLSTSLRAGVPPLPVTAQSIAAACDHLTLNDMDPKIRRACWMTAVRALPPNRPDIADPELVTPVVPVRRRNAQPGTFPRLEKGAVSWTAKACAPLTTEYEAREVLSLARADGITRYLLCAATALNNHGYITTNISLRALVEQPNFDAWLQHESDDSPASTLGTIEAFIRVRRDLFRDDATVHHMLSQKAGRRDHHLLPKAALAEVSAMLDNARSIELTPFALMVVAGRGDIPDRTRLKLANVAATMHLAIEYALMPTDIFAAEHDEAFTFHPPVRLRKAALTPLPVRRAHQDLLRQRRAVHKALGVAPSPRLLCTHTGSAMDSKACAQALDRTQRQFGLIACPWQRYRDFAAGRLLDDDPKNLKRVADLLQIRNPALVELRYRELLARSGQRKDAA